MVEGVVVVVVVVGSCSRTFQLATSLAVCGESSVDI